MRSEELKEKAHRIRKHIVVMLMECGGGHFGGSLSAADILTALYFHVLRIDPKNPQWPERDRFILSKGHACALLCPVLAEAGFFPVDLLSTFNKLDSPFGMHPDMHKIPGCEMSTGSLGHGLSVAVGMALAGKLDGRNYRVFTLMGDGEIYEGSIWEAAMAAGHYKLDNLIGIVDRNGLSLDGPTREIIDLEPLPDKWKDFGWAVREIDGHNMEEIIKALTNVPLVTGKPTVIIARTIKGKGVSFMENAVEWHYNKLTKEQFEQALKELEEVVK